MSKIYRTSRGDMVDMDLLRLKNEDTIAIGNMRTNARGDELGQGGKILRTKSQVMAEYHKLNSDMIDDAPIQTGRPQPQAAPQSNMKTPTVEHVGGVNNTLQDQQWVKPPRGSFADSIANSLANEQEVNQELRQIPPGFGRNRGNNGPTRL